ncbi:MAG: protein TolR [Thermodesulfobacteriota bacterium]|nr:protein TolR [Thermodesulfobacteriota bacterium]
MTSNGDNSFMSDINVTPFVDVMLVLLIIFMVTAPMMMHGVNVSLPQTTSESLPSKENHIVVTVDSNNLVYINDYHVTLDFLKEKLIKIFEGRSDREVYLRADKGIPYGIVVRVMSEIKGAGIERLGMVTEPIIDVNKKKKANGK